MHVSRYCYNFCIQGDLDVPVVTKGSCNQRDLYSSRPHSIKDSGMV